jgi:hypothetical protein
MTYYNLAGTLFTVVELNSMKNQLTMAKALQVHQDGFWLSRGAELEEGVYAIRSNKDKDKAMSLLINEYVFCSMFFLPSFLFLFAMVSLPLLSIYCCLPAFSDTT